jgi:hypothetical protein
MIGSRQFNPLFAGKSVCLKAALLATTLFKKKRHHLLQNVFLHSTMQQSVADNTSHQKIHLLLLVLDNINSSNNTQ